MRGSRVAGIVALVAALHVAVLSMVFGLRHMGYILAATLSAPLIWGLVLFLKARRRRVCFIVGVVAGLAVQQVAYQTWRAELPGSWWALGQFAALQFLVAYGIGKTAPGSDPQNAL
jgi:hypothetical protein